MFLVADMKERVHLDDLDVDWRIILKLIFSIEERTGLIWVTIGTRGDRIIDFQFHNLRSGVAAHPAKSCNGWFRKLRSRCRPLVNVWCDLESATVDKLSAVPSIRLFPPFGCSHFLRPAASNKRRPPNIPLAHAVTNLRRQSGLLLRPGAAWRCVCSWVGWAAASNHFSWHEECNCRLACHAVWFGRYTLTFRRTLLLPSSGCQFCVLSLGLECLSVCLSEISKTQIFKYRKQ